LPTIVLRTAVVTLVIMGLAAPASAQIEWSGCEFAPGTGAGQTSGFEGQKLMRVQTPRLICGDGTRISADSAQVREIDRTARFWGNVRFSDSTTVLTGEFGEYFEIGDSLRMSGGARVEAVGSPSYAEAPVLRYRQAGSFRTVDTLELGGGRTHSVVEAQGDEPPGTDSAPRPTYDILANYQLMAGQESFHAWDDVVITQDSLVASADSAHMDQIQERLFLRGSASVSIGDDELLGHTISALMPGNVIREVIARQGAELRSSDLQFEAPNIILTMMDGEIERIVGVVTNVPLLAARSDPESAEPVVAAAVVEEVVTDPGLAEPGDEPEDSPIAIATSSAFEIRGDSIELYSPAGAMERMFAAGRARLDLVGRDSLNRDDTPPMIGRDWIEGDSIEADFEELPPDPSGQAGDLTLSRLVASGGSARALYRMMPRETGEVPVVVADSLVQTTAGATAAGVTTEESAGGEAIGAGPVTPFSVHYIAEAVRLILEMSAGELTRLEIEGPAHALVLEPTGAGRGGGSGGIGTGGAR